MADLEELKKRLYKSGEQFADRPAVSDWQPGEQFLQPNSEQKMQDITKYWQRDFTRKKTGFNKKTLLIAGVIVLLALVLGFGYFFIFANKFDKNKVALVLESPDRVVGGEDVNFVVKYKNNTKTELDNVKIIFTYPDNSLPSEGQNLIVEKMVDNVLAGKDGEVRFQGKLMGQKDERKEAKASMEYNPHGSSGGFENQATAFSIIIATPISLVFDMPDKIVSGQQLNITLRYINNSSVDFNNLVLKLEYPAGFQFNSSYPDASENNNAWKIDLLNGKKEGKIMISGILEGENDNAKSFGAKIGYDNNLNFVTVADVVGSTIVSVSPLTVTQAVKDRITNIVGLNDRLIYQISYKNNSSVAIPSVLMTLTLQSKALDYASLKVAKGTFDGEKKIIAWSPGSVPELALVQPGDGGIFEFEIKTLAKMPIVNFSDKNFTIKSIAKIDSPNTPLSLYGTQVGGQSELELKVRTNLTLDVKAFYRDSDMLGFGPLPPKVGQKTAYEIKIGVLNSTNDLEDVRVESIILNNMALEGKVMSADSDVKFDRANDIMVWTIGKLSAGVGETMPVKTIAWLESFVPSVNQVGKSLPLLGKTTITAKDTFTGEDLTITVNPLTSAKVSDIKSQEGNVVN